MRTDLFDFDLPGELIAQHPIRPRERARMLHVSDRLQDLHIADLASQIRPGDLWLLNDTRVLPTRFQARRGGAGIEVTLVGESAPDRWWAFAKPGRKARLGDRLELAPGLAASVLEKSPDGRILLGFAESGIELVEAIKTHGAMPLPPYIRRKAGEDVADQQSYQTVFARKDGSVAAPTASLHLDQAMLDRVKAAGAQIAYLTLHVGMGTFLPVKSDDTSEHVMHSEWYEVPQAAVDAITRCRAQGGRVMAVGTTVTRTIESVSSGGKPQAGSGRTDIFIQPGFKFQVIDRLLTNFHLPRSTLFMLISAFSGLERMQTAYAHAIAERYRFFSYGDACLLERA